MDFKLKLIFCMIGIGFLLYIIRSIRKNALDPYQVMFWLFVPIFYLTIPIFEGVYKYTASSLLGFKNATHLIYIVTIGFLLIYVFYLTKKIYDIWNKTIKLICDNARLEEEINELKKQVFKQF